MALYLTKEQGGSVFNVLSGGSLNVAAGGGFSIGNVGISTGKNAPAAAASPGAVYIRTDGSMSNLYINISSGTTGSVWRSACIVN